MAAQLIDPNDPSKALEWFDQVTGNARPPELPPPTGPTIPGAPPPQTPPPAPPPPPPRLGAAVPGTVDEVPRGEVDFGAGPDVVPPPVDLAHEAPSADAPVPVAPYPAPPRMPDPLGDARRAVDTAARDAATAAGNQRSTDLANTADAQNRLAAAQEAHVAALDANNQKYVADREAARRRAQEETGAWLDRVTAHARREPSPNRLWANQDTFGRALWLLGMAFSGAAGIGMRGPDGMPATGAENPVLKMLQTEMAKDVALQRERMAREGDALKTQGDVMFRNQAAVMEDMKDDRTQALLRLQALGKAMESRAQTMTPAEIQRSGAAAAMTYLKQAEVGILSDREQETFAALQSAAQRAHQTEESRLNRIKDIQIAQIHAAATMAKSSGAVKDKDIWHLGKEQGVAIKGRGGGTIDLPVRKEVGDKAAGFLTNASQTHSDLVRLKAAIKNAGAGDLVLDTDREVVSLMSRLAYGQAKIMDPGGRLSDQDINQSLRSVVGDSGSLIRRVIRGGDKQGMIDLIDKAIKNTGYEVKNKLGSWVDRSLLPESLQRDPGSYEIDWVPTQVTAPDEPPRTGDTALAEAGGRPTSVKTPTTVAEFDRAKAAQDAYGKGLPKYDSAPAEKFAADAVHQSPKFVRELARTVEASLTKRRPGEGRYADAAETPSVEQLAVRSEAEKALKVAEEHERQFKTKLVNLQKATVHPYMKGKGAADPLSDPLFVAGLASDSGLGRTDGEYIDALIAEVRRQYPGE